jgi:deoxyadenosine/deoxycytidine kinase
MWEERGLLAAMYQDKLSRCSFQLMALSTRYAVLLDGLASGAELIITERSVFSDRECFAKVNLSEQCEIAAYAATHDALVAALPAGVRTATILLDAPHRVLGERIAKRGRAAEQAADGEGEGADGGIPDEYLVALGKAHEEYFAEKCAPSERSLVDASAKPDAVCAAALAAIRHHRTPLDARESLNEPKEAERPASPLALSPSSVVCSADALEPIQWVEHKSVCTSPPASPPGPRPRNTVEMGGPSLR